ncbi:MAG TPA: hypothetical protein VGQ48_09480 [Gemmatimonadales bacterium]|nr:hypothetical protein [Gemmatimonadales bacterium]
MLRAHAQHFMDGNVDALASGYTADAVVRPAGMDPVRGRDGIRSTLLRQRTGRPLGA